MRLPIPCPSFLAVVLVALFLMQAPAASSPGVPVPVPAEGETSFACGTELTAPEIEAFLERFAFEDPPDPGDTPEAPHYVAIAPHIIRRSDGSGGLPVAQYEQALADANVHYTTASIVFYTAGAIDYIDSDSFYFDIDTLNEINLMRTTNPVPNAINIYFTPNLAYEAGALCGISAFTTSPVQAIAMRNSCTATATNHSSFSHEIGHFFDLFHTHETAFGEELVDGSNCADAGDLICDTPADPQLSTGTVDDSTCSYTGAEVDGNGDPYQPDATQLMSYSRKHCRDKFTNLSLNRAVTTLVNERPELLGSPVSVIGSLDGVSGNAAIALSAPRPNPSAGRIQMQLTLGQSGFVDVTVYDVRGARVRTIAHGPYLAGRHTIGWDGTDALGSLAAPGMYFARGSSRGAGEIRKILLVR